MTTNNTPEPTNYIDRVKAQINDYLDYAVKHLGLEITEENYHDLSFKLQTVAAKYALEDQYNPQHTVLDIIGDLHTSAAIRRYLNITQEELDKLAEDHLILKITDGKGRNGYPAIQFKNGTIRPDIQKIIKTHLDFPDPRDPTQSLCTPWDVAFYLTDEDPRYGGRNLAEHLDKHPEELNKEINRLLGELNHRYSWS